MIKEILECLKQSLPYYERDDKDNYFYIANEADLSRAAINIKKLIEEKQTAPKDEIKPCNNKGCSNYHKNDSMLFEKTNCATFGWNAINTCPDYKP